MLQAQGNLDEALQSYRDSLAIRDHLANAHPNNAGWQSDVAVTHNKVARVLAKQGDVARALGEFRQGREMIARLKEQSPDDAQLLKDLALAQRRACPRGQAH